MTNAAVVGVPDATTRMRQLLGLPVGFEARDGAVVDADAASTAWATAMRWLSHRAVDEGPADDLAAAHPLAGLIPRRPA